MWPRLPSASTGLSPLQRLGSKLLPFLWVEIYYYAVYLYNKTPKYIYNRKLLYKCFYAYLL